MGSTEAPKDLPKMQYRFLGRSGLQVSAISLGGWLTYGGHVENENTFACMKAAYDSGVNFFDCAEVSLLSKRMRQFADAYTHRFRATLVASLNV